MARLRQHRLTILVAGGILAAVLVSSAVGDLSGGTGGAVTRVKVVSGSDLTSQRDNVFGNVPGAATFISVPSSGGLLTARFTALSACTSDSGGVCALRIRASRGSTSRPMEPAGDNNFDAAPTGAAAASAHLEAHAIERSLKVGGGVWKVFVQYAVTGQETVFFLDEWHLTVERSQ